MQPFGSPQYGAGCRRLNMGGDERLLLQAAGRGHDATFPGSPGAGVRTGPGFLWRRQRTDRDCAVSVTVSSGHVIPGAARTRVPVVTIAPCAATSRGQPDPRARHERQDVKALQQRLAALKYYPGAADGKFGAYTLEAVWAFQEVQGLPGGRRSARDRPALARPAAPTVARTRRAAAARRGQPAPTRARPLPEQRGRADQPCLGRWRLLLLLAGRAAPTRSRRPGTSDTPSTSPAGSLCRSA